MDKIDLKKEFKELYRATSEIKRIKADQAILLSVDGQGAPGGDNYQQAINALYSVAYTTKFSLKNAKVMDFSVPCLECLLDSCIKTVILERFNPGSMLFMLDSGLNIARMTPFLKATTSEFFV